MARSYWYMHTPVLPHPFFSIVLFSMVLIASPSFADDIDRSGTVTVRPINKSNDKKAFAEAFKPRDRTIKQTISYAREAEAKVIDGVLKIQKSKPGDASLTLHLVYFSEEKKWAKHSAVTINLSAVDADRLKVKSAWYFDWPNSDWLEISIEKIALDLSQSKGGGGIRVSGTIEVPPMMFMGEPEGKIQLIDNPVSLQSSPASIAQSVNSLLKMKPVFNY